MAELVLLILSAIVGAGFATGAELVTFFGDTGASPLIIAITVGVFLFLIMTAV